MPLQQKLKTLGGLFDLENKEFRIQEMDEIMLDPSFWDDQQKAQAIINESKGLKEVVNEFYSLESDQEELEMTLELLKEEPDEELLAEA
ncbi:MAG TPA: PCRF domain-containing protein, partial [Candidatus Kurthia intestinigallinarum]|nr:PCRF domain-containing protein [Candidatus Kurthia intestinigallinarum]